MLVGHTIDSSIVAAPELLFPPCPLPQDVSLKSNHHFPLILCLIGPPVTFIGFLTQGHVRSFPDVISTEVVTRATLLGKPRLSAL